MLLKKIFTFLFDGFAIWRKIKDHSTLMKRLRARLVFSVVCCVSVFTGISYRLADIMVFSKFRTCKSLKFEQEKVVRKADVVDRNGELLATSIATMSCYADPSAVIDVDDAANKLAKIPGMPVPEKIKQKLTDKKKHFVWLLRHVAPKNQEHVMDLGVPGIHFQKDYKRIYIHGNLFSHIVGCSDIDGVGVCGLEKSFSDKLMKAGKSQRKRLATTLDVRLQAILHECLKDSVEKFKAAGGNGILMSTNGEILAIVSLPDFDPNNLRNSEMAAMFNRNTLGVFEQGSILKILNVAIALDSGSAGLGSVFDASEPIRIGRFRVSDFRGKRRPLTLAEAFVFSSNIASAKIAQNFGGAVQRAYMKKFGMFDMVHLEIPEIGKPIVPKNWSDATTMTVAYGYGLAISPLQLLTSVSSIVNDGIKVSPTLIYGKKQKLEDCVRLISPKTSKAVRDLMRAVVCHGTARKSAIEGADIFGKTGTAYKVQGKGYGSEGGRKRITTFIGGFPKNKPEYMLLISLDDPKAIEETHGFATAGNNVAPTAKNIFQRIIPMLYNGEKPDDSNLHVLKYIRIN
ncbi:MAG: penicillin-binding protein 2 [Holosporales bacterium]|nr:penicillin-binding protein 2 [Holosporales bacterium]